MPSYNQEVLGIAAFCSFNADAAAAAFFLNRGFNPVFVRNGVGDYSLTLANLVNMQIAGLVRCTPQHNAAICIGVEPVSTAVARVRALTNAGAAVDADFWLEVLEVSPA